MHMSCKNNKKGNDLMGSNDNKLGLKETFSMASGFAIGSGVITLTGLAIGRTGRSVVLAYLLSAGMFLLAVIPVLILASVYPVRSASYIYSAQLIHPRVGGFYMFVYFLGRLTIAMFSISFAQYLAALIPGIDQSLVAFSVLTLFYLLNLFGLKWAARMQNIMFATLVIALLLYVAAGMAKVDLSRYFTGTDFLWRAAMGCFLRRPSCFLPWAVQVSWWILAVWSGILPRSSRRWS